MIRASFVLIFSVFLLACNSGNPETSEDVQEDVIIEIVNPKDVLKEDRVSEIKDLEEKLKAGGDQPDKNLARRLMGAYIDFGNFQHHEPEAAEYTYRGADLARYIGRPKKAIELYTNVFNGYPSYERRVEALNWIAFIYDYDLNEKQKAKENYALLIENFSEHALANDARARLETIDLSDDELIELFRKKNQAQ